MGELDFRTWVEDQFHTMAGIYRYRLNIIVSTTLDYCRESNCTGVHVETAIGLLREVSIPTIPKYSGVVTDADRDWYRTCRKPSWDAILAEAMKELEIILQ